MLNVLRLAYRYLSSQICRLILLQRMFAMKLWWVKQRFKFIHHHSGKNVKSEWRDSHWNSPTLITNIFPFIFVAALILYWIQFATRLMFTIGISFPLLIVLWWRWHIDIAFERIVDCTLRHTRYCLLRMLNCAGL